MGRDGSGVTEFRGAIVVSFTIDGDRVRKPLRVNGKPMKATPASRRHAERLVDEIRTKIRLGVFVMHEYFPADPNAAPVRGQTVAAQLDHWLAAKRMETSTRKGYTSATRFWKAAVCDDRGTTLGDKVLLSLKHSDVLRALATKPMLAGGSVNNYVSVLRKALALAVRDKIIATNPVADIEAAPNQKKPADPFTRDEMERIIDRLRAKYPAAVANYAECKFFTGLRTSEIAGLRWSNVDLAREEMLVTEVIVCGEDKETTKTNKTRIVELNPRALAALRAQKAHTFLAGQHVFLDPGTGTPWRVEDTFRRLYWVPTLRALEMRYRRPYNTRHTYATMMLMAGLAPAYCARQLGHAVELFLSTYAKWLDGRDNANQRARLEAFLAGPVAPAGRPIAIAPTYAATDPYAAPAGPFKR